MKLKLLVRPQGCESEKIGTYSQFSPQRTYEDPALENLVALDSFGSS
jgi:hypothetical protein